MRNKLHKLGAASGRLLDIHYSARGVVAVFIHVGYYNEFTNLLEKWKIAPLLDFNPLDHHHLRDPKLLETLTSDEERTTKLREIHQQRLIRALEYMRVHVRRPVARDFVYSGWLTAGMAQSAFTDGTFRITSFLNKESDADDLMQDQPGDTPDSDQ